jgi:hypothetical protein
MFKYIFCTHLYSNFGLEIVLDVSLHSLCNVFFYLFLFHNNILKLLFRPHQTNVGWLILCHVFLKGAAARIGLGNSLISCEIHGLVHSCVKLALSCQDRLSHFSISTVNIDCMMWYGIEIIMEIVQSIYI